MHTRTTILLLSTAALAACAPSRSSDPRPPHLTGRTEATANEFVNSASAEVPIYYLLDKPSCAFRRLSALESTSPNGLRNQAAQMQAHAVVEVRKVVDANTRQGSRGNVGSFGSMLESVTYQGVAIRFKDQSCTT